MWDISQIRKVCYNTERKPRRNKSQIETHFLRILFPCDTILLGGENMTEPNEKRKQAYIPCPICGEKTNVRVYEDTVLVNFPLYCPKCGKEVKIDVFDLRMVQSRK